MRPSPKALLAFLLVSSPLISQCFTVQSNPSKQQQQQLQRQYSSILYSTSPAAHRASRVQDDDGPTPLEEMDEPEEMSLEELSSINDYDPSHHPIAHQPWRRGNTDGCEDPIDAPWRLEAEELITNAVSSTGASVADITWYMAAVVVTLVDDDINNVQQSLDGDGAIEVRVRDSVPPVYFDEDDPEPEDDYGWYEGEEDGRVMNADGTEVEIPGDPYAEREFDEVTGTYLPAPERPARDSAVRNMSEEEIENYISNGMDVKMINRDDRVKNKLSMDEFEIELEALRAQTSYTKEEIEKRAKALRARYLRSEDLAEYYPEEFELVGAEEALQEKLAMPVMERADGVNTYALSTITRAIMDVLDDEDVEERLEILSRHEVILTSEGDEEVYVETQRQFDERRDKPVEVHTQDPFGSNRILEGTLIDRNALDVVINAKGRMVTIPMNMVAYVKIPGAGDLLDDE